MLKKFIILLSLLVCILTIFSLGCSIVDNVKKESAPQYIINTRVDRVSLFKFDGDNGNEDTESVEGLNFIKYVIANGKKEESSYSKHTDYYNKCGDRLNESFYGYKYILDLKDLNLQISEDSYILGASKGNYQYSYIEKPCTGGICQCPSHQTLKFGCYWDDEVVIIYVHSEMWVGCFIDENLEDCTDYYMCFIGEVFHSSIITEYLEVK